MQTEDLMKKLDEIADRTIANHNHLEEVDRKLGEIGTLRHDFNDRIASITELQQINQDRNTEHIEDVIDKMSTMQDLIENMAALSSASDKRIAQHDRALFGDKELNHLGLVESSGVNTKGLAKLTRNWRDLALGGAILLYALKTFGVIDALVLK